MSQGALADEILRRRTFAIISPLTTETTRVRCSGRRMN